MNYKHFSLLYDQLMDEAPYDQWMEFLTTQVNNHYSEAKKVLDLACGTGEMSIRLFERGFDVVGVDLSEDMLSIAYQKATDKGFRIPFFRQNMSELTGLPSFDIVIIFCDSLNYLQTEQDVANTFTSVFQCLNQGGLLLFDVHSPYKMENVYPGATFAYNGDDISYIWNSYAGEYPLSVEHELTFFVLDEQSGKYERYDELHKQRTYPKSQYENWLKAAGFQILSITGDFTNEPVSETTERIFFTVKKP
jgi:2-polyprenyl-3-methyl-5-hydroxy-6-metoxy-1,4-benzoquinol methylase